jgi:dTDP-3-amino-3,4,6-trideoxy-alpha-D-glucose transaminase
MTLHAAILTDALLPKLDQWTERRLATARKYLHGIKNPLIRLPVPGSRSEPVWHLFPTFVAAKLRDSFRGHLQAAGVASGAHYPRIIPDQAALKASRRSEIAMAPVKARRLADEEVSLPIHPFLTEEETDRVVSGCNAWRPST